MKRINFDTCLSNGTRVQVGNRQGIVASSRMVDAANGGKIALNFITFLRKGKRGFGQHRNWENITPTKPQAVNYASIVLI